MRIPEASEKAKKSFKNHPVLFFVIDGSTKSVCAKKKNTKKTKKKKLTN